MTSENRGRDPTSQQGSNYKGSDEVMVEEMVWMWGRESAGRRVLERWTDGQMIDR